MTVCVDFSLIGYNPKALAWINMYIADDGNGL